MKSIRCLLKKGKEKPLQSQHPWVFSGAIDQIDEGFEAGDLIKVYSHDEQFLGIGYLNPASQITVRLLAFQDIPIDEAFFAGRIREALELRKRFLPVDTDACRLVHSEGDFLPGLIVDRYGEYLVVQFLTAGMEKWKETLVAILQKEWPCKGVFEKDDADTRALEGLKTHVGLLAGEEPPQLVEVRENGLTFWVDVRFGHKTGFYLDQRDSRQLIGGISRGKKVLNCFSYTGGFSVYAARCGATETVSVESSQPALDTAKLNFEKNGLLQPAHQMVKDDVFQYLRSCQDTFDLVVLDPPSFCKSKHQVDQAGRGYKDINLCALKRVRAGGVLYTCSCSSFIDPALFQKIIFGAAKDAGRRLRILAKTSHPFDHPINIYHPEGEYLKGLLCEVE
ncbi:MAG: class I SAM-dependent rRNA methyltransferase [Candidatus Omnitrophica bacterium]|nr:class I SAM-dependent rRNA methyltransferase [Candidatus Omnitrophota bacterium]MDD5672026.1 class I SAM-dependent rRNA methyltransferase [Candidatus Omnitrophota bacterium]